MAFKKLQNLHKVCLGLNTISIEVCFFDIMPLSFSLDKAQYIFTFINTVHSHYLGCSTVNINIYFDAKMQLVFIFLS